MKTLIPIISTLLVIFAFIKLLQSHTGQQWLKHYQQRLKSYQSQYDYVADKENDK
ncbi:MAG: hypothetical protein HY052_01285 [Proteobacteria bacterium]|nr:hypothetical protein [Pseudomonadota bacterium]